MTSSSTAVAPAAGAAQIMRSVHGGKTRVLVAVCARARSRLSAILAGSQATFVGSYDEARKALERGDFDLVVIGIHFDHSSGVSHRSRAAWR